MKQQIESQIAACENRLLKLQGAVIRQQWETMAFETDAYKKEIQQLEQIQQSQALDSDNHLESFLRLHNLQRKVMRQLFQSRLSIIEDMESSDRGIARLEQARALISR